MIYNLKKLSRPIDFTGLELTNLIHPTDIDLVLEFKNKYLLIAEFKEEGKGLPMGQKLVIERICNAWGVGSVGVFVQHKDTEVIQVLESTTHSCYYNGSWYTRKENFVEFTKSLLNYWGVNKDYNG